jgi:pSer/pThr/pTyr-binding forkhead associated (FHA) protein
MTVGNTKAQFMFRFREDGKWGSLHDLVNAQYSIGRGLADDPNAVDFVRQDDPVLSRLHCFLVNVGDTYAVHNESRNGTCVNGKPIRGPTRLDHRDTVEMGDDTALQFLIVDPEERKRLLREQSGTTAKQAEPGSEGRPAGGGEKKKSRVLYYVLAAYAVLGLLIVVALTTPDEEVEDPGGGPYFSDLFDAPLDDGRGKQEAGERDPARTVRLTRPMRDALWEEARARYDGPARDLPGNRWRLLVEAIRLLRLDGRYESGLQAFRQGDPVAVAAKALRDELSVEIAALYREAKAREAGSLKPQAASAWREVVARVPDRTRPVHRYAVWRMGELMPDDEE